MPAQQLLVDAQAFTWLERQGYVAANPRFGPRIREGSHFHLALAGLDAYWRAHVGALATAADC